MADWFSENAPKPQAGGDWFAQNAPAPGFGQRVYQQTLQGPVELAKGLWNDPKGTFMQTIASMAATQMQAARNPLQVQQGLATPIIEDVRSGNWPGAAGGVTGLALDVFAPKILSKVPGAAKVTSAGVRAAAPDVAAGAAKVGAGYAMEHMLPGAGYLKYAVELPTAYAGARQIGRGLNKGAAAIRQSLRDRATAAAESLAKERAAAAEASRPVVIPEERRLASPPDTSYVRAVPAEPLPPSRQLAAPGRPAIITPEPDAPPDTSFVRAVPAEPAEVIPEPLRKNPAASTAAEQMREEMIRSGTITRENVTPITKKSGAEKTVANREAKAERFVEPLKRFKFSTRDVKGFGEAEWEKFANAIGEDVPSPDTIAEIRLRMSKRK